LASYPSNRRPDGRPNGEQWELSGSTPTAFVPELLQFPHRCREVPLMQKAGEGKGRRRDLLQAMMLQVLTASARGRSGHDHRRAARREFATVMTWARFSNEQVVGARRSGRRKRPKLEKGLADTTPTHGKRDQEYLATSIPRSREYNAQAGPRSPSRIRVRWWRIPCEFQPRSRPPVARIDVRAGPAGRFHLISVATRGQPAVTKGFTMVDMEQPAELQWRKWPFEWQGLRFRSFIP